MHANRPLVVLDTNVWISGIVFGGNPEKIIRLFVERRIDVAVSEELLSELRRKFYQRFPLFLPKLDALEYSLQKDAALVKLGYHLVAASRDPDDNKIIETALSAQATHIISGDNDLLVLERFHNIAILKPTKFLEILRPNHE